jgi:hypothetical protein
MSDNIRIRTTPNGDDKYVTVKLEQEFDFIEILSLKISQEDTYRKFCSDYGVITGRVIINNGFGVPNAKVSVFIPLDDIDKENPLIKGLYPFEVISDTDSEGIRYNLLPKKSVSENECYTPVGTFPDKREILDNDSILHVYSKYYKFTTTTNESGDYMIFGVPLGTYTVHVDADISDIGVASQRPYDLISQGTPTKLFDSSTKFKADKNLNKLIQVKTLNAGVNVQPFWGDLETCEIGITRLDFDLNYSIIPSAIFMGSIYGDQDKQSINKRCRPRKKLGLLCEQVTSTGSVNMIRKTLDDTIEEFDVEGGRVIDDDGTWAYQVPMNLDYMVTGEDGTLIPSQDPNKGVPTRARVRFKIGMDETGGEGRLRTRANYLVPNNPQTEGEVDYSFDETTKDSSFKNLYWNKIYSVSNYISRFQKDSGNENKKVGNRSITGVKSVDACAGDKTPFPYNRVDTEINPLFFAICLIIKIVGAVVFLINKIVIPIINAIINVINFIKGLLNDLYGIICDISQTSFLGVTPFGFLSPACGKQQTESDPVGCISIECDESYYSPGCKTGTDGYNVADAENGPLITCSGGGIDLCGLDDCIAFQVAQALNMINFDFYNDWVNGTLYSFLLKYKKKKKGREKFCEYDCSPDFPNGTDGNNDGNADNKCRSSLLLDTCFDSGDGTTGKDSQKKGSETNTIKEGLIKKVGDEFYYAATTQNLNYKLFATDLIVLGSVFDCDWQGIPKLQHLLIPTSYKIPEDTPQRDDVTNEIESYGMVEVDDDAGLFFTINCLGLHVDYGQCLNIRHICEMGVEQDEAVEDGINGPDAIIGSNDIDDDGGKFFRNIFTTLNQPSETPTSLGTILTDTNFNLNNQVKYNFATTTSNGVDYVNFRGLTNDTSYGPQSKHSYFFYFGILPGKTALDKMNNRFFTTCKQGKTNDFLIQSNTTQYVSISNMGTLTFSFIGGNGLINYSIVGTNSTSYGPTIGTYTAGSGIDVVIPNLEIGTYSIIAEDAFGNLITNDFVVSGPQPLYATVTKTKDSTTSASNDGEITITSVGGGSGSYEAQLETFSGGVVYSWQSFVTPKIFNNLPSDNINGYTVKVRDTLNAIVTFNNILVNGPNALVTTTTQENVLCFGNNNGKITITSTGGVPPRTYNTTGPAGYTSTSTILNGLVGGTYTTVVTDSASPVATNTLTTIITQPLQLKILTPVQSELEKQCNPNAYEIPFYIAASSGIPAGPVDVEYSIDSGAWTPLSMNYVNETTPMLLVLSNTIVDTDSNIRIRFNRNQSGNLCYSNTMIVDVSSIDLPPTTLSIMTDSTDILFNLNQCTPSYVSFRFRLSHLARAPYSISYTVNGGSIQTSTSSTNPITLASAVVGSTANINLTVTDSKGCVANSILNIALPTTVLTGSIATTGPDNGGNYTHIVSAVGGIAPYTNVGTFTDTNSTYTTTVIDSVGCTNTVTG